MGLQNFKYAYEKEFFGLFFFSMSDVYVLLILFQKASYYNGDL